MRDLFNAGLFFIFDLLSSLVFAAVFALTDNVYVATAVGIGLGLGQILWVRARGRPIDAMQWLSLGLVIVFGAVTLTTHDAVFIKLKPSLIYLAVSVVMLKPGWMTRYMPRIVTDTAPDVVFVFGFIWAGLMFVTATANLAVAFLWDTKVYVAFLAVFPVTSKLALFCLQYVSTRLWVRRRLRAQLQTGGQAPDAA